jgi:hypothetical protein
MPNLYSFILPITIMYFGTCIFVCNFWGKQIFNAIEDYIDFDLAKGIILIWYGIWLIFITFGRYIQMVYEINNHTQNL